MKLEEKNGLRILHPNYGYLLKNKENGSIYTGKIYLGINASPDIYEEVRDETVNDSLFNTKVDVQNKEASLNKIGKIVANQVTDEAVALTIQEFYDIRELVQHMKLVDIYNTKTYYTKYYNHTQVRKHGRQM